MTIKRFLLLAVLFMALPVNANQEFMNFEYWNKYNDEILNEHLRTLYSNNHDLKIATYKTKQALENIRLVGANQLPQAYFNPEIMRNFKGSTHRFGDVEIPQYTQTNILLPIEASYEIDIWGQNYLSKKAAKKQKEMALEDEKAAYIYITSNFASTYFNLIKADATEKITKKIVETQKEIVRLTEKKYNNGLCSKNELLNEKQILIENEEILNKVKENKKVLNNQLISLLGENSDVEIAHSSIDKINYPQTPDSISATAIQYRPDLKKSEFYAQKVGIDVQVAKREFLPKFILYGNIGFNAYNRGSFFSGDTFLANLGILPKWDIFSGGVKLARYRINKYEYKKAGEIYQQTVLNSLQELNNALVQTKTTKANLKKSEECTNIEKEKNILANKEYNIGNASKLDKMKSDISLMIEEQKHISYRIDNIISTITLYNAIGGKDYTKIDVL